MNKFKIQHLLILILPVLTSWISAMLPGMQSGPFGPPLMYIGLGAAFLTGLMALYIRYLGGHWHYLLAIVISLIYSALSFKMMGAPISIMSLFMINLVFSILTILIVNYVFYIKTLFRFRTLLFGLAGALIFSAYLAFLYQLLTIELQDGFWNVSFMYGLILYVFIGFGLSMADLIILRLDVAQLKNTSSQEDDS
ncbi:MAG: hypothetical protein LHW64_05435 [Candidatus Cloacimonetes bacterium]|jgi:hypothetical protein|nr:hypothetical protein [Candidatus Cloacimonadota bacterium]MCB5287225.1 hypothetical protein [Candidatus Cloacimonadota bacterium]MCK9184541.1 hypothetical protein [Candidatus Cloacimonadota bacterium]MCK9584395.1 hypothetical protein [Candidatus Cloacimonadota bacterium]MDY0229546.1 hypothetical protein [Candidatus Cloacimonadaceae bacterium]